MADQWKPGTSVKVLRSPYTDRGPRKNDTGVITRVVGPAVLIEVEGIANPMHGGWVFFPDQLEVTP